jgi:nicotinate phosphoribosyltransferase
VVKIKAVSTRMGILGDLYRPGLGLLTDLYELTMVYAAFKTGIHQREAVFQLCFRQHPFGGGFTVACGLAAVVEYLERLAFDAADLDYLAGLRGNDGRALFDAAFLDFLGHMRLTCDVDAVPEGTVVFPHEPLLRVAGPLGQAQLLETALLNLVNFPTLIATKAARVVLAAGTQPVLDFGLRRAQGIDGGLTASRAAYVGGCAATSNVLAGRLYGIPVRGTHAHSWVMAFDDEREAFQAYAQVLPNNCVFLVDTYNTLEGVRHAIEVGRGLRERGYRLVGIRLDSGDLAHLSIEARRLLDEAGFTDAQVVASSELDEQVIESLKQQGARIDVWGVGTRLVTGQPEAALGGVYKLTAVADAAGCWQDRIKLSEQAVKTSTPGIPQVRRFFAAGEALGDAIYDVRRAPCGDCTLVDLSDTGRRQTISAGTEHMDLLVPVFRRGRRVYEAPALDASRRRTQEQLAAFPPHVKRLANARAYPVGLELGLHERKMALIFKARGHSPS